MINLFKNPFALLNVTVQDAPETIREAAARAVAEEGLSKEEAEGAATMLLDPAARVEAEVSWLLGRSVPRVRKILDALSDPPEEHARMALLESIDGVARSNLAAHLCSVERAGVPFVRTMVECQNEIDPQAVFWLVNGNREVAGVPPADESTLWSALENLQAQHCAAVCESIANREEHRKFMVRLFADGWNPEGPAYTFLERVVAAYDAWYDAHLAAIEKRLAGHITKIMEDSANTKATEGIKECLALWDEYSAPLQHPTVNDEAVMKRAESIHGHVSGLCGFLARERWRYRAALQISESLRYAFPDLPPVQLPLPEQLDALGTMLSQPPATGAPQELAQVMMHLQRHPKALAESLAAGDFSRGNTRPAGKLYGAFTDAMASAHGTPAGEGIWIMLRCQALDLATRHGQTAGAVGLLEGLLAQADDHLMPSEVRRMLEADVTRLEHGRNVRRLNSLMAKKKYHAAEKLVEALLLNPTDEAIHDDLVAHRATIQEALEKPQGLPWRWLLAGLGILVVALILVLIFFR